MNTALRRALRAAALALLAALLLAPAASFAAQPPVKELPSAQFGWDINKTKVQEAAKGASVTQAEENICTVASKDECQEAIQSSGPGGMTYPQIAVNTDPASGRYGDLYLAENSNNRVEELTSGGAFVSMFGWDVNRTKVEEAARGASVTQAEENVCTAASQDECQAGSAQSAPGGFSEGLRVSVDPSSGDVYAADAGSERARVQKFTAGGAFLWELGKSVNRRTGGNLCTVEEEPECTSPAPQSGPDAEPLAFYQSSPLLAAGPGGTLYVGETHRVKELDAEGKAIDEIPLTQLADEPDDHVAALAVDQAGDVYLRYPGEDYPRRESLIIRKFNPANEEIATAPWPLTLSARREGPGSGGELYLGAIAVDPSGRLAVSEYENRGAGGASFSFFFGSLIDTSSGLLISQFRTEFGPRVSEYQSTNPTRTVNISVLAFNANGDLFAGGRAELFAYTPAVIGEPATKPASCLPGADAASSATFDCTVNGEVNPWGVGDTEAWFQWGLGTSLGMSTPAQKLCVSCAETPVPVTPAVLAGLAPNATYQYRLAAEDANIKAPEILTGEESSFTTTPVRPRVIGAPIASQLTSSSAVLFAKLNPENSPTEYFFEYGSELGAYCQGTLVTAAHSSAVYGPIGTTLEVSALQPATSYRYRLCAINQVGTALDEHGVGAVAEGEFQTTPLPAPQANTGMASAIGATSATISGSVDSAGQPAVYGFELGVYAGAGTQLGRVLSSPLAGGPASEQALALTGLQPGTTYAYRIVLQDGYGIAVGQTVTFTTRGLPAVLVSPTALPLLAAPSIEFPVAGPVASSKAKPVKAKPKCRRGGGGSRHGSCRARGRAGGRRRKGARRSDR